MKKIIVLSLAVFIIGACSKKRYLSDEKINLPAAAAQKDLSEIREKIQNSAQRCDWVCQETGFNKLTCDRVMRNDKVVVDIHYTQTDFAISSSMVDENGKIHKKYFKWIKKLTKIIRKDLGKMN